MDIKKLKVNIKSLAAEAVIIRKEEHGATGDEREKLHNHRVVKLRREPRHAQLAYAFLRGRKYSQTEQVVKNPPDIKRVQKKVIKFGGDAEKLTEWFKT